MYILIMNDTNQDEFTRDELEAVRANITRARKQKGLTQVELAQKMGITQRVISYYEKEAKTISLDAVSKIAKALDISTSKILITNKEIQDLPDLPVAFQKRIAKIKELTPKSQKTIYDVIDGMIRAEGV